MKTASHQKISESLGNPNKKYWKLSKISFFSFIIFALLGFLEIFLRLAFGFGSLPLVKADSDIGYLFKPNQRLVRFGKRIEYNRYSQRSSSLAPKARNTTRILVIGDSIVNGGALSDQALTIPELLAHHLSTPDHKVEALNASAGSWGLGNELAYIHKFGLFNSDSIIIVIGSGDLAQAKSTSALVGNPTHPDRNPPLALFEIVSYLQKYSYRLLPSSVLQNVNSSIEGKASKIDELNQLQLDNIHFKENIAYFDKIVSEIGRTPLYIVYFPYFEQLERNDVQTLKFKTQFFEHVEKHNVTIVDTTAILSDLKAEDLKKIQRDSVHPNEEGNKLIADFVALKLCPKLGIKKCEHTEKF